MLIRNPNTTTNHAPAVRYQHRDGTEHELIVRHTPTGGYAIVDRASAGEQETLVEQLGRSEQMAAAVAIARDYATTHSP